MTKRVASLIKVSGFCLLLAALYLSSCDQQEHIPKVLVFSKTTGYRHASIPAGQAAIVALGKEHGFTVDTTENAQMINEENLEQYAAVIFLSTTGDVLNADQEADFKRYIQAGRGFVGIHAATDTEYHWGWYNRLVGGYFASHPETQEARIERVDSTHQSTKHLGKEWIRTDEWYNFKALYPEVNVLLNLDETSYEGGANGEHHPIAWYHEFDGGRSWYTALGHTPESFGEDAFLKHLSGGILYAIGDNKPYQWDEISAQRRPEDNRLDRVMLVEGQLVEPTEFTILPNLDIIVVERRGSVYHYSDKSKRLQQIGHLDVYYETEVENVNAEEGLMGIQASPDFAETGHLFLFYSPADSSVNRLSRFRLTEDTLDLSSEKIVLEFYSQRDICCHTGGSIAFSGDGSQLFLSTGDNSTPFDEEGEKYQNLGFAPLDERVGHEAYDARRSSGNTNDLRGKILRINIQKDGSYTIPEGNLFPPGTPNTRPEIYIMGNRNPYRISVDPKTNDLYWGEVGPDAAVDELDERGPRGYDEVNKATKAGFYGWPFFVGNNFAYHQYDYQSGRSGTVFDPAKTINSSRNNTGLSTLPPAQPAFIWYPYGESHDFPAVGSGGRNAMAGPVYYNDQYAAEFRYPDYYNGKLFIYDWIRNWILLANMHEDGTLDKLEPFMPEEELHNVIDMEVGPDGRIYLLEYGSGWFSKNPDAGISRIDFYGGNRPPQIDSLLVNKTSAKLPFELRATVLVSDPEAQKLIYDWQVGYEVYQTKTPELNITLEEAGNYQINCRVTDEEGAARTSESLLLYAGNEAPEVNIEVAGNQDMYFKGSPLNYQVTVSDDDDFVMDKLIIQTKYTASLAATSGHLQGSGDKIGAELIASFDCASCHKKDEKSIGPSYKAIADHYRGNKLAMAHLSEKIIQGGNGVWGEVAMAPHPAISTAEANFIASWILSIDQPAKAIISLPASGAFIPAKPDDSGRSTLQLWATYTDTPPQGIKPLTTSVAIALQDNYFQANEWKQGEGFRSAKHLKEDVWQMLPQRAWLKLRTLDLTDANRVRLDLCWEDDLVGDYAFELRSGSQEGPVLANWQSLKSDRKGKKQQLSGPINKDQHTASQALYLVARPLVEEHPDKAILFKGLGFYVE